MYMSLLDACMFSRLDMTQNHTSIIVLVFYNILLNMHNFMQEKLAKSPYKLILYAHNTLNIVSKIIML